MGRTVKEVIMYVEVEEQNIIDVIIMSNSQPNPISEQHQQLNYHARKKGKHAKHQKFRSSPLHDHKLNSLVITPRSHNKSNTIPPESLNNSIIWLNELNTQDPNQILIVEGEESEEMLIVESEEPEYIVSSGSIRERRILEQRTFQPKSQTEKTQILICEDREDLLWINKQQYFEQNSPYIQETLNTLSSQKQNESISQCHRMRGTNHRRELSNIEEQSSQAEDDGEDPINQQFLGREPISPQTQPLIKLKPIIDFRSESVRKRIEADQQNKCEKLQRVEHLMANIKIEELFPKKRISLNKKLVSDLLKKQKSRLFDSQLQQLSQLTKQTLSNNRNHIQQIARILQQQQHQLQMKLDRQQHLLLHLKCSLLVGSQIVSPIHIDADRSQLSTEQQIRLNTNLLRRMVAFACRR